MTGDRLTDSEKRALMLWVLAGIVGSLFAYKYFFLAYPEASVNFQVSREEARQRAQRFVTGMGGDVNGYRSNIVFDVDDNAKIYLEREVGLQRANQLMSSELNVWHWSVRFFRPEQQEEFRVSVNPGGQVVGYEHEIEESRAGASLGRDEAQSLAQAYVLGKLGRDLATWELLPEQASSKKLPKRTDWSFTWEKKGFRAKEAPYRLQVSVQGDRVGGSSEYLKVPEAWERDFKKLRSVNDVLALVFIVPYLVLLGLAVRLAVQLTQQGQTAWKGAILVGLAAAALLFAQNLNDWPLWGAGYDTNQSYGVFLALKLTQALLLAVVSALTITLVLPAAEPLYRASQPNRLRLGEAVTVRGWRSKEFFSASVVGISLAAVHIGYVVAFYIVANRFFGAWAPQDLKYQDSVNTLFPWISGAAIGLLASTNEEFTFRLFAIPYLQRLTGSRWVAVVVPAFLWSFLHSNYPQEPPYVRGIEIGLMGIVAGLVMLRWGILATLIWHYTVDAVLVGLLLIRSQSLYFKLSGIIVGLAAVAPLAISAISYLRRRSFEADEDLVNRAKPVQEVSLEMVAGGVEAGATARKYRALTPGFVGLCVLCAVGGSVALWRAKAPAIGDYLRMTLNAKSATAEADTVLRQHGLNPDAYYHAAVFLNNTDATVNEYLRQRIGTAALNEIYAKRVPGALWRIRYFRDAQPEEYAVVLRPDGTVHSLRHTLAEAAPGASLSKEEVVARAGKFLGDEKHVDVSKWSLVDSDSEKRPHRLDYTLTWQENAALESAAATGADAEDQAHARIEVQVLGDEVTNYRTYIKIPEEWRRSRDKLTLGRIALSYGLKGFVFLGIGLAALVSFLRNLRTEAARKIPWRRLFLWSAWLAAAFLATFALGGSRLLSLYDTSIPFKITMVSVGIGTLIGGTFYFGGIVLLFGMAYYFALSAFAEDELPNWTGMPGAYYRDAALIGVGGALGILGLSRGLEAIAASWSAAHRAADAAFGRNFDAVLPGPLILANAVQRGILFTALMCFVGAFLAARVHHASVRAALFVLGAAALVGANWGNGADFARMFAAEAVLLGAIVAGARWVARLNLLGYFLAAALITILTGMAELFAQPEAFYRANGYVLVVGLILLLAWPLVAWLRVPARHRQ